MPCIPQLPTSETAHFCQGRAEYRHRGTVDLLLFPRDDPYDGVLTCTVSGEILDIVEGLTSTFFRDMIVILRV